MERHGYGRKTFTIETDKDGEPVVHRVDGKFTEDYYYEGSTDSKVWEELYEYFDDPQHLYFLAIDLSQEVFNSGEACGLGGISFFPLSGYSPLFAGKTALRHRDETQGEEVLGGSAIIPVSGPCFEDNRGFQHRLRVTTHELGHAFGLEHDVREGSEDTVLGKSGFRLSKCDAEWLSVSRFFNTKPVSPNTPGEIKLLSLRTYNQDAVSLHFEVTDPDGLHHAQLLVPTILEDPERAGWGPYRLFDCKQLSGETSRIESTVRKAEIVDRVTFQIMDTNGYITWATFLVNFDEVVPTRDTLDVNSDGIVNISDLTPIASRYGRRGKNPADVNEDRVVDITDLLLVAATVSALPQEVVETFDATEVQKWLTDANQLGIENEYQGKGMVLLQRLLAEIELSSRPTEVATGPLKAIFGGHTDYVWSVAFSPDGERLASGSSDKTIRFWDLHTRELETTLIEHTNFIHSVVFSPDGQTLANTSSDGTIRLWNTHNGKHIKTLIGHKDWVTSVAFSPDGQTLASGGAGGKILLRDTDTWQLKETLTQPTHFVEVIAFSPDGKTLASGSQDNIIRLWNPNNGKLKSILTGHTQTIKSIAFSPDGNTLASGSRDRTIRLWNPNNGKLKRTLTGYTDWMNPVAFSPDGTLLATGNGRSIRLWNTQTDEFKNLLDGHTGYILSVAFSPDGTTLASGSADKTVQLWDVQMLLDESPTLELGPKKITGPWLWMIAPTKTRQGGARSNNVDSLAEASKGSVTEAEVAANGAREGDSVGGLVWMLGEIAESGGDNVNDLLNNIGMARGDVDDHSSYALITLESATQQSNVTMRAGSDDSIKIWLNREVVHNNPINRGAQGYQDRFTVDLKRGDNLLLVKVSERDGGWSMFVGIDAEVNAVYKRPSDPRPSVDVNGDGIVNILDLVLVSSNFGKAGQNPADVNGDGIVNIIDLVKVAGEMGGGAAAPSAHPHALEMLTAADVQHWLIQAQHLRFTDATSQRGILMLEQLLAALIPKETSLLPNYPNPFNPETWIPYHLATSSVVKITIYNVRGTIVRQLDLGHQPVGYYTSRSRAAYWDGRNAVGEPVASEVYFYTLTAGNFTATRKMLILK